MSPMRFCRSSWLKVANPLIWPCTPVTAMDSVADELSAPVSPKDGSSESVLSVLTLASV